MDKLARVVVEPGRWAYNKIKKEFGDDIIAEDGQIDRKKLGNIVFKDPSLRKKLEKITHYPIFWEMFKSLFFHYCKGTPLIILDVPLLFEVGLDKFTNTVIVVYCDKETQIKRIMKRDNVSEDQAIDRINSQMSTEDKVKKANIVINNDEGIEELKIKTLNAIKKAHEVRDWLPRNSLITYIATILLVYIIYLLK